ncbi:MAG: bifunctional glycosyltransferase family 2/GtrA family protein [Oscillospiraceae bacterium]|nr:bifunctional glycosyltransferase family 2/GtrA family protein [Oscillospiraceae bacterium]MBQ7129727.1 bifunctional glycosyltransferase family 2/GtrA family protein [Oscillospiraceae bacterium]
MKDLSKISVVLPSLDPDEKLVAVIDGLLEYGFSDIILVNDGSKPENLHYFEDAAAQHPEIHLLHHEVNKGKGAALKNAFRWFLANRPEGYGVVTVDGDNQHHPADTRACCEHMLETGHVILGCRDFNQEDVPARSSFGNKTTSMIFKIFVGMTISDTQTGLRAIPRNVLETLVDVYGDRFEYETNMLLAFKTNGIDFDEVKIRTVYIEENKSSHFRVIHDSWRIYKLILAHFFRYTASSIASFVVDSGMVYLLTVALRGFLQDPLLGSIATVGARAVSSILNFFMNKKLVFQSKVSTGKAMVRYYALAIPQLVVQSLLNQAVYTLFSIGSDQAALRTLIHIVIMTILFIVSFTIQQRWVFAPQKSK